MAEYVITPDKKEIPSSYLLTEDCTDGPWRLKWKSTERTIRNGKIFTFSTRPTPGPRCFLERNLHSLIYKITLAAEPTHESEELQTTLVEIILHEVGGKVFDPDAKKSYSLEEFSVQSGGTGLAMEPNNVSFSSPVTRSFPLFKK